MVDVPKIPDAVLVAAVEGDDEIGSRVREFLTATLDEAMHMIEHGTPEVQASMIRSAMPALAKQAQSSSESEVIVAMRERQDALMIEVRAALTSAAAVPPVDVVVVAVAPIDGAPGKNPKPIPRRTK